MPAVIGIDHIYITVSDLEQSEKFYDAVMDVLGFKKNKFQLEYENHIQYYNRHFGYVIRPSRSKDSHNPYSVGLHHFCLRVESKNEVDEVAIKLRDKNIAVSGPKQYSEYAPDYYAVFLSDPDGVKLEVTNYREERRNRYDNWNSLES